MIKKILFATDLSDNSRHAFKYAANLANQYQAGLVLFHVMEGLSDNFKNRVTSFLGREAWEHIRDSKQTGVREILIGKKTERQVMKNALSQISAKLQTDGQLDPFQADEIIIGAGQSVAEDIRLMAKQKKCDAIVMSGRGESLLDRASLGRITRDVLKRASVPVLVVPPIK